MKCRRTMFFDTREQMEISLFEITRANYICNSELPFRFHKDRLLYFDFVVMDLYAEYLLETPVSHESK